MLNQKCEEAFNSIKEHLVIAPILTCPNFKLLFTIQTDASDFDFGAVLTQTRDDIEKVISYERKYSVTEKALLVVLFAIEKF